MNIILWVLQVLLALAFLAHGLLLLFPPAEMVAQMAFMPTPFRIFWGDPLAFGVGSNEISFEDHRT